MMIIVGLMVLLIGSISVYEYIFCDTATLLVQIIELQVLVIRF